VIVLPTAKRFSEIAHYGIRSAPDAARSAQRAIVNIPDDLSHSSPNARELTVALIKEVVAQGPLPRAATGYFGNQGGLRKMAYCCVQADLAGSSFPAGSGFSSSGDIMKRPPHPENAFFKQAVLNQVRSFRREFDLIFYH